MSRSSGCSEDVQLSRRARYLRGGKGFREVMDKSLLNASFETRLRDNDAPRSSSFAPALTMTEPSTFSALDEEALSKYLPQKMMPQLRIVKGCTRSAVSAASRQSKALL